jgi:hypothetical protein
MDRPLIIINFQGVLGDFQKDTDSVLSVRRGSIEGLKLLMNHF